MRDMESTRTGPQTAGRARQQPSLVQPDQETDAAVVNPATLAAWEKKGAPPGRAKPAGLPAVSPELAAVQLVDGKTAAQVGSMSLSWWNEKVAEGVAPQPVFRAPRCTRFRMSDVAAFWRDFRPSEAAAASCVGQAVKASRMAWERRRPAAAKEVA